MSKSSIQLKLAELRQALGALQQFALEDPGQVREVLPGVLADLQQSVGELQAIVHHAPEGERGGATPGARRNGNGRSLEVRPDRRPRYRAMGEGDPLLVRIMDAEDRCRWTNRGWLRFTGRSPEEMRGSRWLEHVHPEDRDRCTATWREVCGARRPGRVEYRFLRKGGTYGWLLELVAPRLTSRGSVNGYLGTATEITESKQAETHLALQYASARSMSVAETLEEAAVPILRVLCESLGWDVGDLWLVGSRESAPRLAGSWAAPSIHASLVQSLSAAMPIPATLGPPWQSGDPLWIADITTAPAASGGPDRHEHGLHGMLLLPVSVRGEVRAILRFFSREVRKQSDSVMELLSSIGMQIGQFLDRQLAEEKLRQSEARRIAILDAAIDGVITIDGQGRVMDYNSAAASIFGYRSERVVGSVLLDLVVPPRMRKLALACLARYRTSGEGALLERRLTAFMMKSDGSRFPAEIAIAPMGGCDRPLFTIYVCDATARKRAEREVRRYQERVRTLMADMLVIEERERRKLAIDLHDGLSQTIALIRLKLSELRPLVKGAKARLREIDELIEQANHATRSVSFELSPPVLHDLGLEPALHWLVENIQSRYGIEIVLKSDGRDKPADEKTRVILFRSIRELLINAAKHARARRVQVRLKRERDHINASIEDDGVGMEPDLAGSEGSGLLSIHERLSHVGGSMRIESAPGGGTSIHLCAPLAYNGSRRGRFKG